MNFARCIFPALLAVYGLAPCAAKAETLEGRFPDREQLENLTPDELPPMLFALRVHDPETWTLEGPFPERVEAKPFRDPSKAGALLAEEAERRAGIVLPTEAMHCVARELGRFLLAHNAQPTTGLRRFIAARCRATSGEVGFAYVGFQVPEKADAEAVLEQRSDQIKNFLSAQLAGGPLTAGVWFGRQGERVVMTVARGMRRVRIDPLSGALRTGGAVEIAGEVLESAEAVSALMNRGAFGYQACQQDRSVALPRFAFLCNAEADNRPSLITVQLQPTGRLLARKALDLLLIPEGATHAVYRRPESSAEGSAEVTAETAASKTAEVVNALRARAGLEALRVSSGQSAVGQQLVPHFLTGAFGDAPAFSVDFVTLGMLAGWSVEGLVQSGDVLWDWQPGSRDVGRLLASMVEYPEGRAVLLNEESDVLAVGSLLEEEGGNSVLALLLATYDTFGEAVHAADVETVMSALTDGRAARSREAPRVLDSVARLCSHAASEIQAGAEPKDALNALLQEATETTNQPVSGWIYEGSSLEELSFPEEFLTLAKLEVGIAVAHRKPEGEAWGRYVVLIVAAGPEFRAADLPSAAPGDLPARRAD
jgi:hypothetical protein